MCEVTTSRPLVSVIMPAYNAELYIEAAVKSVLNQTMSDFELLIMDDCSKDNTLALAERLAETDFRIKVFQNERNLGVAETRNKGMALAEGDYIALLDSDDLWHPDKLEKQLHLAMVSGAQIIYASYTMFSNDGIATYADFIVPEETNFNKILTKNVLGCSTVMFTKEIAKKYKFDESFYHEDYILWLRLLQDGYRAVGVVEPLVDYRIVETSRSANKKDSAKRRWVIYREYLKLPILKSVSCFIRYAIAGVLKYKKR